MYLQLQGSECTFDIFGHAVKFLPSCASSSLTHTICFISFAVAVGSGLESSVRAGVMV